jgi:hypothetical protein
MADTKISGLTALTGANVDTAADVIPIVDTGVTTTKKITVDELGLALAPFIDSQAHIRGSADSTKKVRFEVDGLTTATTRVVTVPDKNGTMAMTSDLASTVLRSYISGCELSNNGSDATNDIDVAAGSCADSTNAVMITVAALTKQLDANWAAGTNQGMRYSGAAIANTTYHIWAVAKADGTQDIYATPNASAATASGALTLLQAESGGADYVYARRIGSILRESAAIVGFVQDGNDFMRKSPVLDVSALNPGTSAVTRTLSVPTGIRVEARVQVSYASGNDVQGSAYLSDLSQTDLQASVSAAPLSSVSNDSQTIFVSSGPMGVYTNTSGQIRSRQDNSDAATVIRIATLGWTDTRGA